METKDQKTSRTTEYFATLAVALFGAMPDILKEVMISFWAPQWGPYHNEGPYMHNHLDAIFHVLDDVDGGEFLPLFHPDVPEGVGMVMSRAAGTFAHLIHPYVLLHDMQKHNCLTLIYGDERQKAVTWDEWVKMVQSVCKFCDGTGNISDRPRCEQPSYMYSCDCYRRPENIRRLCEQEGIVQISYYQQVGETVRQHGEMAAEMLAATGYNPLVVKAIGCHEIAYQFGGRGGINIPLFEKTFGGWTDDEVAFGLLVNYADQMGSLGSNGQSNMIAFRWLALTYLAARQFAELKRRVEATPRIDMHRATTRLLYAMRRAPDVFQSETPEQAYVRIVAECAILCVDETKARQALQPFVTSGAINADLYEELISALVSTGQIPKEMGKRLGGANKAVREAVAACKAQ